jgi:tetratricopeptide (TPR) repeat protein
MLPSSRQTKIGKANLRDLFAAAIRHHQLGRLAEAESLYRQILGHFPHHAESHDLLALTLAARGRMDDAETGFRRAVICKPDSAEPYNNLGLAARERRRLGAAVAACAYAIRIRPVFAEAHNTLGLLSAQGGARHHLCAVICAPDMAEAYANLASRLIEQGLVDAALSPVRRSLLLRPAVAASHYTMATILADDAPDDALAACRAALACQPDCAQAHNLIGLILLRRGDLAGAARGHRRAAVCQSDPAYYNNLAAVHRFGAQDGELAAMERLIGQVDTMTAEARITLHFALGKAYDDCGESVKAFRHYQEANQRKRRVIDYDEPAALSMIERTRSSFDGELITRMGGRGDPSTVPIFILGMPRSGSTLIEQILASHRAVHGGDERSDFPELLGRIGYPEPAASLSEEGFSALGAAYAARLRALAPSALRVTDKLPGNFLYAGAIHLALPQARIIHSRRDAADTCFSCFTKLFRDEQQAFTYDLGELGRYYRAYQGLMAHWRALLPATVFLDVDYEALIDDTEGQARRLLAHCGLDWDPACLDFHHTRREVRTHSAAQVRRPIYRGSMGRWKHYGDLLEPLLRDLEEP